MNKTREYYFVVNNSTGINLVNNEIPKKYELFQNYPNPFNPSTKIRYTIPKTAGLVSLKIYGILGNEVSVLVNQVQSPGSYEVTFAASELPSGIYFYKLTTSGFSQVRKMILLK
jgi:hypothetical protein